MRGLSSNPVLFFASRISIHAPCGGCRLHNRQLPCQDNFNTRPHAWLSRGENKQKALALFQYTPPFGGCRKTITHDIIAKFQYTPHAGAVPIVKSLIFSFLISIHAPCGGCLDLDCERL